MTVTDLTEITQSVTYCCAMHWPRLLHLLHHLQLLLGTTMDQTAVQGYECTYNISITYTYTIFVCSDTQTQHVCQTSLKSQMHCALYQQSCLHVLRPTPTRLPSTFALSPRCRVVRSRSAGIRQPFTADKK